MNRHLSRFLKVLGVIVIVLVVAYSSIAVLLYSSVGRFPLRGMPPPEVRIEELSWPTIGYPSLASPGSELEVEFDFTSGRGAKGQPASPASWEAVLTPSESQPAGPTYSLGAARAWMERSTRWPEGTARGGPSPVWHVSFELPEETALMLYDLTVRVEAGGRTYSDSEPHAVSVDERPADSFTFVTLADIHVHRLGISGSFNVQTDKGISPDGRPVFFERAIEQVNLLRPRFAVLLGDFVRAQRSAGDYQVEFDRFYRALSSFQVPVFLVPGNHDTYVNEVDGALVWEKSLGPLYYSFDVAGSHFTAVNSSDWPRTDRMVMEKLGLFVYPRKWQGQVREAAGERDPRSYTGQLAWLRDDLAAHSGSRMRVMLVHHDPYSPRGKARAFRNERFALAFTMGGGGEGAAALREMASRNRVSFVFSGHNHEDSVGEVEWRDGGGKTVYAGQTCVYYDEGGMDESYPGYRLVEVVEGRVRSFAYMDGRSSFPFYDGSSPGGLTDLDRLDRPALAAGRSDALAWRVDSYLGQPVLLRGVMAVVPRSPAGYEATGGRVYRSIDLPGGTSSLVFVEASLPAGVPGVSATRPGTPASVEVSLTPGGYSAVTPNTRSSSGKNVSSSSM